MFSQSPLCNIFNFCCCQSFHLLKSLDFSDCYATSLITTDRKSIFGGKKIIWKFSRIFFSIMSFHVYKSRCFLVVHLFALCFYGDYFLIVSIFFTVKSQFLVRITFIRQVRSYILRIVLADLETEHRQEFTQISHTLYTKWVKGG